MPSNTLSDGALSIFVFAAYHSLVSGEQVRQVVLDDGNGHRADPQGIEELTGAGLLAVEGDRASFTDTGEKALEKFLSTLRTNAPYAS